MAGPAGKTTDGAMRVLAAIVPAGLAAAHVGNVADAAHDAGVARALGLAPQAWRSLDVVVASALSWVPLGTRAARAAMGETLMLAGAGLALYLLARRLAGACAEAPRLGPLTAALATFCAVCGSLWQLEGASVAGSVTGALLVVLPLALVSRPLDDEAPPPWRAGLFALALAFSYEPLVGACALAACAAHAGVGTPVRRSLVRACKTDAGALAACLLAGLGPLLLALARTRAAGLPLGPALADAAWAGERGMSHAGSPMMLVRTELGAVLGAMAVAGAVLVALVPQARALGAGVLAMVVVGLASGWLGAPVGPTRTGAPVLAAVGGACVFAGVAMQALVRAIATAKLPLAQASAAMVLVLLLAIPVDAADEALLRAQAPSAGAAALWDDLAWGALPPRAVVIVTDARLGRRAAAAQATGSLRGDLAVVPAQARGVAAARVLAEDPALVPLWRDLELAGTPSEASLSSLASSRPLVMAFEPRWGRALGRHLVPVALLDRFEPEPRGASDRRKALASFAADRARLAQAVAHDPELADATAYLLRARALDVASSGDRDLVGRAVEDLKAFAPDDPVGAAIVARVVLGKAAAKLEELRP